MNNRSMIKLLLLFSCYVSTNNQLTCDEKDFKKLEEYASKGTTMGDPDRKFPENVKKWKKWCRYNFLYYEWKVKFNDKCVKGFPQQMFNLIEYSYRRSMTSKWCNPDGEFHSRLIASAPCFNINKKDIDYCYFKYIDELLGAMNDVKEKRVRYFCCGGLRFGSCVSKRLIKRPGCDQANVQTFGEYIFSFGTDRQDFCDRSSKNSESCDQLGLPPKKKKNQRSKSFILTMINLFSVFKESPY